MRVVASIVIVMGFAAVAGAQSGGPSAQPGVLPKDIDPQSFSRLPVLKRDDMDADGKRVYDMLAGGPDKTVTPTGPVAISLYSPKIAEAIQMLNQYLRFHGVLSHRDSEVAILVAAREFDQQYEWSGHEMAARAAMVPESVIDAIKHGKDAVGFSDKDTLIVNFARQLLRQHKLDPDLYAKAVATFGKQGTLELATVVGDYAMAAVMLTAADQHLPPNQKPTLPPK
jgi:4-carboxymuconolactone decarboxylase